MSPRAPLLRALCGVSVIDGEGVAEEGAQGLRVAGKRRAVGHVETHEALQARKAADVTLDAGAVQEQHLQPETKIKTH